MSAKWPSTSAASALLATLLLVVVLSGLTGLRNTLALLMLLWALGRLTYDRQIPPLILPMAAWLLMGASSALWAPEAELALKAALYDIVLPAGVFYGAWLVCRQPQAYRVACVALMAGAIVLAGLILAVLLADPEIQDSGPMGLYTGVGITSTLAVYALPVALLLVNSSTRGVTLLGYVGLVCVLVAGIASQNRMFWLSVVAVVAVFCAWQWARLSWLQRAVLAALVLVMGSIIGSYIDVKAGRGPLDVVARDNRPTSWKEWGRIAMREPLLGYGFGLKTVSAIGKDNLPGTFWEANPEMRFHSHNLLLNIVLQVGIVGLLLFVALLGALVKEAWRARDGPESRAASGALVGLIVAMLTKNMTDDFMHHAGVIAFWAYAGILAGRLFSPTSSCAPDC